jgi:hypothetical protein
MLPGSLFRRGLFNRALVSIGIYANADHLFSRAACVVHLEYLLVNQIEDLTVVFTVTDPGAESAIASSVGSADKR